MAAQPQEDNYTLIINTIRHWSAERRFKLVQDVLQTLDPAQKTIHPRQPTLARALGIAYTDHPPTDAEVEQILDEYCQEKYG
jgi:hypothetical protein